MRCITSGTFASRATHSGSVLRRSYSGWEWRDWRTVRTNARRCASCSGSSPFSLAMSALRREMVAERYTLLMGACMVSSLLIAALSVRASLLLHSSGGRCRDARLAAVARRRAGSPARGNCRRRGLPDPRGPPRRLRACPRNRSSVRLARSAGCVESSPSPSALPIVTLRAVPSVGGETVKKCWSVTRRIECEMGKQSQIKTGTKYED